MTQLLSERQRVLTPHVRPSARPLVAGVTVIIPCYNEESGAATTVRQVSRVLAEAERPHEIITIDDGSTDGTTRVLECCGDISELVVLRNARNRGYGYSIKRAIQQSSFDLIVITDADGTYPNDRIAELIDRMDGVDMVVGARTGPNVCAPLIRRPAKWILRKLASYLADTDIPDLNSGLRVMKRSLVKRFLPLLPDGFSFTTTITLALLTHGHEVRYVPINYAKRIGTSSIRPVRDTMTFLSLIVRTVLYFKPLKVFAPVSAALFASAILLAIVTKLWWGEVADVTAVTLALGAVQLLAIGLLADLIDKRSPAYSS